MLISSSLLGLASANLTESGAYLRNFVSPDTVTVGRVSPWSDRILKVITLPLLAATMPEIPRAFQSRRSRSSRLPISAADMTTMRRTFVLSGSSVTRTRSPIASSVTLTATALLRVFSPGATLCAMVSAVSFTSIGAALSGLISSSVSGLNAAIVPMKDLPAGACAAAGRRPKTTSSNAASAILFIFSSEQCSGPGCALSFVKVRSRQSDLSEFELKWHHEEMETEFERSRSDRSILIVEDDTELCSLMSDFISTHGFQLEAVHDGRQGLARALEGDFDLVILDVMLPVLDGFELLRIMRKRSAIPVIMLTARTSQDDRITGLNAGADDYLPKPFGPEELLARIRAVLRRVTKAEMAESRTISSGGVELNPRTREVWRQGESVEVTTIEFDILEFLMRSAGRAVSQIGRA